ncbi:Zinc finger protein [Musa troglodytarum]|uniref:Zinc finger protein n=1 Tax=Musa troglodytarum TaxID=320322 RepID=A0A9E7HHW2_9LILI|nr:Zinc finger protein [Musa troglodytarum]
MEFHMNHAMAEKRHAAQNRRPTAVRWFKEWVPQDVVATGGKCMLLKWVTECAKRFTNESKLRTHIKTQHEKSTVMDMVKHTTPVEKPHTTPKSSAAAYGSGSAERPYVCPYEGCGKAYIHEYKLNLHFRREHPGHNSEENGKPSPAVDQAAEEGSDQEVYLAKRSVGKNSKRSKPNLTPQMPPAKASNRKGTSSTPKKSTPVVVKKQLPSKEMYEEDSEETEEDHDNAEEDEGWRRQEVNGDDEETEEEE